MYVLEELCESDHLHVFKCKKIQVFILKLWNKSWNEPQQTDEVNISIWETHRVFYFEEAFISTRKLKI